VIRAGHAVVVAVDSAGVATRGEKTEGEKDIII